MQNKINIENYEAFLLDHMEGTISKENLFELHVFAAQHPHLNIDLNDLELVALVTDEVSFENKDGLKKAGISDEKFVAYIENELSPEEKQKIDVLCAKDEKSAKDLKLFHHTIIKADTSIVFESKNELKKQETKILWLFSREVLAAAASLILIMGLWFMFRNFVSGTETLNSQKINGIGKANTITLHKSGSASSFTAEKKNDDILKHTNNNPVAYSTVKEKNNSLKEERELIANNTAKENTPKENFPVTNTIAVSNTIAVNNVVTANKDNSSKQEPVKTSVNPNPKPYVILEKAYDEDEKQLASNVKGGFWKRAMKALNGLNKLGVKRVNGTENTQSHNEEYLLSMGNISIENKRYNAE
jgi:hypothetical protein